MDVTVIGYGRFGRLLTEILAQDMRVYVYDCNEISDQLPEQATRVDLKRALSTDTIFYAVPISAFEETLQEHTALIKNAGEKLLIDLLSVKVYPKNVFKALLPPNARAILTHPMFGPDSVREQGLSGQVMVMDQFTANKEEYHSWKKYFSSKGLNIFECTAEEHDKMAADSQGLAHFVGRVLEKFDLQPTPIDTLGAKKLIEIKEQTCNDSWELFTDLQTKNPFTVDMRVRLGRAVNEIYDALLPNRIDTDTLVVGIQGGKGSFNEEAANYYLGRKSEENFKIEYLYTTEKVLNALQRGEIDRGLFAIHNSAGGVVNETVYAISRYRFNIVEEFAIKISHALMIRKDTDLEDVDTIMTHPQVIKQCRGNLQRRFPRLKAISGEGELIDSANVAKALSEGKLDQNIAVMGSKVLADIYNLKIVEDNLQDLEENYTSFLWVERPRPDS
ncbi:MAG: prephenate dehydrogenase/arogenate dehydrogenase family protein [Candidatus Dadabacteria bacterium]|nr:MAG: prephenate dehydrogenase/arogenate dehydrogenase family protein [Candidatus Dadabacteria bacterium]